LAAADRLIPTVASGATPLWQKRQWIRISLEQPSAAPYTGIRSYLGESALWQAAGRNHARVAVVLSRFGARPPDGEGIPGSPD